MCKSIAVLTTVVAALAVAPLHAGLVSYWDFNDGTGSSTAADQTGGRTGNLTNMDTASDWVAGHTGGVGDFSLDFDGSNDFVTVPTYKGQAGRSARTISAWIRPSSGANDDVISSWGADTTGNKWVFRTQTSNGTPQTPRVEVNGGYRVGSTDVVDTGWRHVAATWEDDGTNNVDDVKLYVNGVEEAYSATLAQALNTATSQNFRVGGESFPADRSFLGQIDDVAVWNRTLIASEIAQLAGGTSPTAISQVAPQAGLDYNAALDSTPTNEFWENLTSRSTNHDWSINNNDDGARLVDVNAPGWTINKAYSFDGGGDTATTTTIEGFPGNPSNDSASFEIVFRPSDTTGQEILFETGGTTGTSFAIDGTSLLFTTAQASIATTEQLSFAGITDDFLHAVGVIERVGNGASLSLYVNGVLVDSSTSDLADWSGTNNAGLGQSFGGGTVETGGNFGNILDGFGKFAGEISIFRFYDTLLTPSDVQSLYADVFVPEPSACILGLLAITALGLPARRRRRR